MYSLLAKEANKGRKEEQKYMGHRGEKK